MGELGTRVCFLVFFVFMYLFTHDINQHKDKKKMQYGSVKNPNLKRSNPPIDMHTLIHMVRVLTVKVKKPKR